MNNKEIQAKVDEWFKDGFEKGSTPMQQMEQRMNPQFMESIQILDKQAEDFLTIWADGERIVIRDDRPKRLRKN